MILSDLVDVIKAFWFDFVNASVRPLKLQLLWKAATAVATSVRSNRGTMQDTITDHNFDREHFFFISLHRVMFDKNAGIAPSRSLSNDGTLLIGSDPQFKPKQKADWLSVLQTRCIVQSEVSWCNCLNHFQTELNGTG